MKRRPVNKSAAARGFRSDVARTKRVNMAAAPMRGGWRL